VRNREFGRLGWRVSEIGYGAWQIGGTQWGTVTVQRAEAALRAALEAGIDFFDTAMAYGNQRSEQIVGRVLRQENAIGRVRVATKVPPLNRRWPADARTPLEEVFPAEHIRASAEASLRALGIEPIDLMQLHVWTDAWATDSEWYDALSRLKDDGKIRAFGVSISEYDPDSALQVTRSGKIDSIQLIYNALEQAPEARLLPAARAARVAVIARVPLDEGALTGTLTEQTRFAPDDFRAQFFAPAKLPEYVRRVEAVRPLLEENGQDMATGALRFCLSNPDVATVIVGSTKEEHVRRNAAVSDLGPLPPATLSALRAHAWDRRPK
jgi:aryl-alcohol dehydrogenase-like predicted oxidoreductase